MIRTRAGLVVCALVLVCAAAASATPTGPAFECDGRLYISAIATETALQEVELDPLAMPAFTLRTIGATHDVPWNSLGYNRQDDYIYSIITDTGVVYRIHSDGTYEELGIQGFPPSPSAFYVGDVDKDGIYWVYSPSQDMAVLIDLTTTPPTAIKRYDFDMNGVGVADWAFNPIDDKLYAVGAGQTVVVDAPNCVDAVPLVDPMTGELNAGSCTTTLIGPDFAIPSMGAHFFDSSGVLYGYVNDEDGTNGAIYAFEVLDPSAVTATRLGTAPLVSGMDGAACPGAFDFFKTASPEFAAFDEVVTYTFTIELSFSFGLTGVSIDDTLNVDMAWENSPVRVVTGTVDNLVTNAYAGSNVLSMTFDIPGAVETVAFEVDARTPLAPPADTILINQASLSNLPIFAQPPDGVRLSDNPNTPDPFDTTVVVVELDFGDAPFETSIAQGGAYHVRVSGSVTPIQLGSAWDNELDGAPSALADGDDNAGTSDEDGITFSSSFDPGETSSIDVTITGEAGRLELWIDSAAAGTQGVFDPTMDYVIANRAVSVGTETISFSLPLDAVQGITYMRARVHQTASGRQDTMPFLPTGQMSSGEVEDYLVLVGCPLMRTVNACTCTLPHWELIIDVSKQVDSLPLVRMYLPTRIVVRQLSPSTSPFVDSDVQLDILNEDQTLERPLITGRTLQPDGSIELLVVPHHLFTGVYEFGLYGAQSNCYLARTTLFLWGSEVTWSDAEEN